MEQNLSQVLHMDAQSVGAATALPFVLSLFVKLSAGPISDRMTYVSEKVAFLHAQPARISRTPH